MIAQLNTQTGVFVAEVETPNAAALIIFGTRNFVLQDDGTYREATGTPSDQAVSIPSPGFLGGIKNEDGF